MPSMQLFKKLQTEFNKLLKYKNRKYIHYIQHFQTYQKKILYG